MTITVIIPVHNGASALRSCLEAVCASRYPHYECIVVDDGSTDGSGEVAASFPVRVVEVPVGPRGPAYARNRAAEAAGGDILLFVDADVVLQPDTLSKVADAFSERPDVDAVFGSYDDRPRDLSFLSQYKNLFHHFVHQQAHEEAGTFWSGCGAIRRGAFHAIGGFDEARHPRPSSEDIELGYRLRAGGRTVRLNKHIQVQHLKRWTLKGMLMSDVWERALPWTRLILEYKTLPNDLNLRVSHRVCALLVCLLLLYLGAILFFQPTALLNIVLLLLLVGAFVLVVGNWSGAVPPVLFGVVVLSAVAAAGILLASLSLLVALPLVGVVLLIALINRGILMFFVQKRGVLFALASFPFYVSHYLYGVAAFVAGIALFVLNRPGAGHRSSRRPLSGNDADPTVATGAADLTKQSSR